MSLFLVLLGKIVIFISKSLNLGGGSTWPGHIALSMNKNFIKDLLITHNSSLKTILVAGTNGKTTTVKLIETILKADGKKVFRNEAGANLLNGIASTLIQYCNLVGRVSYDYAIIEVDENSLPLTLKEFNPDYLVILNLFRDQLDRYGETDIIAKKWQKALKNLSQETTLILNADDPQIAELGFPRHPKESPASQGEALKQGEALQEGTKILYFGLNESNTKKHEHAVDSVHCPQCGEKLTYKSITYSHLGNWHCLNCKNKRPKLDIEDFDSYPLSGTYNKYNTLAAVLTAKTNNISNSTIKQSLQNFKPAFGRQETIQYEGKEIKIFLSKNPTGFNESLRTVTELGAQNILLVLNDRIPDGRDVSWIWDVDFEEFLTNKQTVMISGDRAYDMGLRIKYSQSLIYYLEENLESALTKSMQVLQKSETLYILPTYSAMLEVRKILTGRKLL